MSTRPLVKNVYQKINFLISQPKHMLWVLKRTVSMRRFFGAPITYFQTDGLEIIYNFTLKNFVYLHLWSTHEKIGNKKIVTTLLSKGLYRFKIFLEVALGIPLNERLPKSSHNEWFKVEKRKL